MSNDDYKTIVRNAYEAFDRHDGAPLMAALADDVDWSDPLPDDHPVGGTFRGKAAVREYFAALSQIAEIRAFEIVDIVGEGDKVVAQMHLETTMRHNGADFVGDSAHVWTFNAEGRASSYRIYADTERIMAAFRA
ncbi:nuclear transport factor 2 family protein [Subtercola sp. YIM 133946]|uniref:nuclear transport factor 2 family protein n=1 Tax=Subtercola sp. YIM 133946 TaxID=3118909 RepID=UPI002F944726